VLSSLDPRHIRDFFPMLVEVTQRLQVRWARAAALDTPIDLQADLMRYTVDVTTGLAFGENINSLEAVGEEGIQKHLNAVLPALFGRILSPVRLPSFLDPAARRLVVHIEALRVAVAGYVQRTQRQLQQEPALRAEPRNLIQAMVAAREEPGSGLTDEDVAGNVLTMLLAGEDTTANSLAWLVWLLARNPREMAAARAEVARVLGASGRVSDPSQLAQLEHVEACIHEALRLKPVAPIILAEALQEVRVADVTVPRRGVVICVMRPASMSEQHFLNPSEFDPARWRDGDAHASPASARRVSIPFGAGPRMCPGRYLAMAEMKMAMAR